MLAKAPKRFRAFGLKCIVVFASLTVSLLFAECLFRAYEQTVFSARYADDRGMIDFRALNYNDTVLPVAKPVDEFRILSFGDSFAYSIAAYEHSYSGVAAKLATAHSRDRTMRIVNLGEPATSVNDYMAAYTYWAAELNPDAALFTIYLGNDLLDIAFRYTPLQWTPNWINGELEFHIADGSQRTHIPHRFFLRLFDYIYTYYISYTYSSLLPKKDISIGDFRIMFKSKIEDKRYTLAATHNLPEDLYFEIYKTQMINFDFSQIDKLLSGYVAMCHFMRFVSTLLEKGQKVLVTLAPSEPQVDDALRTALEDRFHLNRQTYSLGLPASIISEIRRRVDPRIPLVDLTRYFQCRHQAGERLYYKRNTHWNIAGNALAGTVIARALLEDWFHIHTDVAPDIEPVCKDTSQPQTDTAQRDKVHAFVSEVVLPHASASAPQT